MTTAHVPDPGPLLAALLSDAPVGLALLDTSLRFVLVNSTLAAVNGVPARDHLGRHVSEVLPDLDPSAVAALEQVLRSGTPLRDVEVAGRTPASPDHKTWLEDFFRVHGADGEVLGVGVFLGDVSARRSSERRLGQLINSLATFVGLCLPDGTLIEANRSALEAGGLESADVIGRKVWDTPWWNWDPATAQGVRAAVERARAGESSRYDADVMMAGGLVTIDFQLVPVIEAGEVVALVPSATDITARRRSVEQAGGLAALARRLNAVATVTEVADVIRSHTADAIGGLHATLALLDDAVPGSIRLLQSPSLPEHVAQEFTSLPADSPNHIARCIARRSTVVVADPVTLDDVGGSPEELLRLRAGRAGAGVTVTAATPLFGADGTTLGALAAGWARTEDVDEERLARLRTVAELCAQAIERARLADAHVAAARRSRALAALAQDLASAITPDEVWLSVVRLAPPVVGARHATLGLLDVDGTTLEVRYPPELPERLLRDHSHLPLTARRPQSDAARTGEAVLLPTVADHERRYPGLLASLAVDPVASAVLPLRDGADRIIGTLAFGWDVAVPFDPLLRSTFDTLAELCGQTLERARLHAAEHELVAGLQRRLLRPMPAVPGLAAHAVYRAAQTAVGIGGDFHDGLVLPGGRLAVLLGDVAGHGMEAAADMAQLRTMLSTLLAAGTPLADLFPRADAALDQVAALSLATAVAAVVDPVARTLSYVYAGHPPLVLRTPDGLTAPLSGGRGGLLGLGICAAEPVTVPFEPGSVLVGYTDGLVEIRGASLDDGIATLVAATAELAGQPGGQPDGQPDDGEPGDARRAARIAAGILDRCVGDRRLTDDVALLVVSSPLGQVNRATSTATSSAAAVPNLATASMSCPATASAVPPGQPARTAASPSSPNSPLSPRASMTPSV